MERLKSFLKNLPDDVAKESFALLCGTTLGHMRNAIYGLRKLAPENCVAIERATAGAVRRWDLRPADWHRIWPELIGAEGAPAVPQPATAAA